MTAPVPSLRYVLSVPEPYLFGGERRLFRVFEVTAHAWSDGLCMFARGPMMKKDGTRGRHERTSVINVDAGQPDWMAAIIADARRRLADDLDGA